MKKLFLLLVGCLFSILPMLSQSSLVATLNHNDTISAYYGLHALVNAYNNAKDGDIITLSPGQFTATDINKNITIRGAGMDADSAKHRKPTILIGDFQLLNSTKVYRAITIEGIYHDAKIKYGENINSVSFRKCRLNTVTDNYSTFSSGNFYFTNCKISEYCNIKRKESIAEFTNSVINNPTNTDEGKYLYQNCIIIQNPTKISYSYMTNCILYAKDIQSSQNMDNTINNATNCYATGTSEDIWLNMKDGYNKTVSDIFKTFKGTYSDDESFELKDEAKEKCLGNDGTEAGIYGGEMPYESTPLIPQITKFKVAPKSTPEGKLSIDITVE